MDYKRVLILHYTNGMSSREIAEATGDGKTTIRKTNLDKLHLGINNT